MKKILWILLISLLIIPSISFADNDDVIVEIPDYKIRVNGQLIDTVHSEYPILQYKYITYFPMTSDYLAGLGLQLRYDASSFRIDRVNADAALEQKFLSGYNTLGSKKHAKVAPFKIYVNGQLLDNKNETYPVLHYKNITYFPMTWRFTVDEFGWQTKWSETTGYEIVVGEYEEKIITDTVLESIPQKSSEGIVKLNDSMIIQGKSIAYNGFSVDLNQENISVKTAMANDTVGTVNALDTIAESKNAVLAINGTYFNAYLKDDSPKDPYGILVVDGQLVHNGNDRATIGFRDGQVDIDRVDVSIKGTNKNKGNDLAWIGYWMNHSTSENGVNLTIFDENRGYETKSYFGTNYVVKNGKIIDIIKDQSVVIPKGGYVINLNGTLGATPEQVYERFQIGYSVDFDIDFTPETTSNDAFWNDIPYATGAGPALILNGKKDIDFIGEHFTEAKIKTSSAARSAIGYTKDNQLLMITTTATIDELADLMLALGCYEAMNLDGGASSGLWFEGDYVRTPGREISNIIYVEVE